MSTWFEKKRLEAEKKFLNLLNKNNTYTIPKYLKQAEFPFLQKSVNEKYKDMNHRLTNEFGQKMQEIYEKDHDTHYIGIHRTGADINKLMKEGISYSSSGLYGYNSNDRENDYFPQDIHDHVQIIKNFPQLLYSLASAHQYKHSTASLIIKIPKKDIDPKFETDETRDPIYYAKDDKIYLKPEYIIGYVPVKFEEFEQLGIINQFISNKNIHKYDMNTKYIYDEAVASLVEQKKRY